METIKNIFITLIETGETGGVKLSALAGKDTINISPRPVFYEELNLLGLNTLGWQYPECKEPLLWACNKEYYYCGDLVFEAKNANIYDKATIVFQPGKEELKLKPVDMKKMLERTKEQMFLCESEAEGITDSIRALDEAGILHVGAGENLDEAKAMETVTIHGKTIGFLGVSRVYMSADWAAGASHPGVFSTYDPTLALEEITKAKEQVDYLVVYVHWGVERETTPKEYQKTMGRRYIDAGADLVIGSHPHVLQPVEYYNEKPIVYSLGNFVFGSSIPSTELLKVVLGEDGVTLTEIPCTSSAGYTRAK